jgi:hypothetical protein
VLAVVFQILWGDADGGVRKEDVVLADAGGTFDKHMRHEPRACADFDIGAEDAVWSYFGGVCDDRAWID